MKKVITICVAVVSISLLSACSLLKSGTETSESVQEQYEGGDLFTPLEATDNSIESITEDEQSVEESAEANTEDEVEASYTTNLTVEEQLMQSQFMSDFNSSISDLGEKTDSCTVRDYGDGDLVIYIMISGDKYNAVGYTHKEAEEMICDVIVYDENNEQIREYSGALDISIGVEESEPEVEEEVTQEEAGEQ